MVELRVIHGIKKEKPDYYKIYANAFIKALQNSIDKTGGGSITDMDLDTRKKVVLYGVKKTNVTDFDKFDYESLINEFNLISSIHVIMGSLTPREIQTLFPIAKEYDGERYGEKDYFYTKRYIEEFGEDKVIGKEIDHFLWEFLNNETRNFVVKNMSVMSAIRRAEGGMGIMEEFLEKQGVTFHTMREDSEGKKFIVDSNTGEVTKVRKPRPKHLKIVK